MTILTTADLIVTAPARVNLEKHPTTIARAYRVAQFIRTERVYSAVQASTRTVSLRKRVSLLKPFTPRGLTPPF